MRIKFIVVAIVAIIALSYLSADFNTLNPVNGLWSAAGNANYTSGNYHIPDLQYPVNVTIDSSGVAHIQARNLHDLFMAQGYYEASNRLFQMELEALLASGNLSSYVGTSALNSDIAMHMIGIPQNAALLNSYVRTDYPQYYGYIQDYSQGVNAYINASAGNVPLGFKLIGKKPFQWSPFDSFAWQEYMTWDLTTGGTSQLQTDLLYSALGYANLSQIWPYYPYYTTNITMVPGNGTVNGFNLSDIGISSEYLWSLNWYSQFATGLNTSLFGSLKGLMENALSNISDPYGFSTRNTLRPEVGSNSWIVTSNYSSLHSPILANDPHLTLLAPSLWIPVQLEAPGINATGWGLAGLPGILIGHTTTTSWGLTTPEGATANDYLEMINGNNYTYNGKEYAMSEYNYSLLGSKYSIFYTNNGPIIARSGDLGISMNWTASIPSPDLVAEIKLDMSTNYSQMINALRLWESPPQNFVLAGTHNTGYITAGLYPTINETLPNGQKVAVIGSRSLLNGSNPAYRITGQVPFKYLPQIENPARGFAFAPNQPTVGVNYPYPFIGGFWTSGGRAQTIYHYLKSHGNTTVQDMMNLQSNVSDYWASQFVPLILKSLSSMSMNTSQAAAYSILSQWNYTSYVNSTGETVYWYYLSELYNITFDQVYAEHGLSSLTKPFDTSTLYLAINDPSSATWFNGSFNHTSRTAFTREVSLLLQKLGPVSTWTWGRVHILEIASLTGLSALGLGPYPMYGDSHTVSAAYVSRQLQVPEPYVTVGPSLREVSDPAKSIFYGVFPGGPSENPVSYYFSNQLTAWFDHQYYNMSTQTTEVRFVYD